MPYHPVGSAHPAGEICQQVCQDQRRVTKEIGQARQDGHKQGDDQPQRYDQQGSQRHGDYVGQQTHQADLVEVQGHQRRRAQSGSQ